MQMEDQKARVKISSKRVGVLEDLKPYGLCIFSGICFAGFNMVSKASLDKGMSPYVLVVYGHAFGTLSTALLALLFERKNESKIDVPVLRNVFFMGLLAGVLGRTLYYMGLKATTTTFASSICNIIPSFTFIIAVLCRMEKFDIRNLGTQAKIGGTLIAFAGATLMILYKGILVISVHSTQASHKASSATNSSSSIDKDWIKASVVLLVSCCSLSSFFVLQTFTIKMYPAPITLTSMTSFSGTLLSAIMAAILDHKASSWKLSWNITLLAPLYSGVVVFGIVAYVQTLVVRTRGPVFTTAFRPMTTVIVAIMGLFILGEAIHLGSILGASLIVLGLYATLWGKNKEKQMDLMLKQAAVSQQEATEIELEK